MATNVQRAKAIADAITDRDIGAQLLSEFVDDCILLRPELFTPADPANPTNEERAAVMVEMFSAYAMNKRAAAYRQRKMAATETEARAKARELQP